MEKELLNKFKEIHLQQPLFNNNNDQKYYQF